MSGLVQILIVLGVCGAAAAAGVVAIALWWRHRAAQWTKAWDLVDSQPEDALTLFQKFAPRRVTRPGSAKARQKLSRAHLGEGLCQLRLARIGEAAAALAKAEQLSALSDDDHVLLCRAYLVVDAEQLPDAAIDAWIKLLKLGEDVCDQPMREDAQARLRGLLEVNEGDAPDRLQQIVARSRAVIEAAGHLAWAHYSLGSALLTLERNEEATAALEKAVELDPEHAQAWLKLGQAYARLEKYEQAQQALNASLLLSPSPQTACEAAFASMKWLDQLGTEHEQYRSTLENALELLTKVTEEDPQNATAWEGLSRAQWQLGRRVEAIASVKEAIRLQPENAPAHATLGRNLLAQGDRAPARESLGRAFELDSNLGDVVRLCGDLDWEDGKYKDALVLYRRLHTRGEADDKAVDRLAQCYLETGEPESALELLARVDSPSTDARLVLGRCQARLGRWGEALKTLGGVKPAAVTPKYRYYLANAQAANRNYPVAEKLFSQLLEDETWGQLARRQLGHVQLLQGKPQQAAEQYSANGSSSQNAVDLGRMALMSDDPQGAKQHFEQAVQRNGKSSLARFGLAIAHSRMGDTSLLKRFPKGSRLFPLAIEELANSEFEQRRYVDALAYYAEAIKGRSHVTTGMLCRMTDAYLQLRRYKDALPHLVELHRRRVEDNNVAANLAICRFHLGRRHFDAEHWELARKEFEQAARLLKPLDPAQSDAIAAWQLESAYREAVRILGEAAGNRSQLMRVCKLLEAGAEARPNEMRWHFASGLALALLGDFLASADCFEKAHRLKTGHHYTMLGWGLSLHGADQGARTRKVLARLLESLEKNGDASQERIAVAGRFALVSSCAKDREWKQAAEGIVPLIEHPMIASSGSIDAKDVAQVAIAYLAAAGDKENASKLAQQHLPDARLGKVLVGLILADSGDYQGAVDALGAAYNKQRDPKVLGVLVGCILAQAAKAIKDGDLKTAEKAVGQALRYDESHSVAQSLRDALAFARNLSKLDVKKLNEAIGQCQTMFDGGDRSPHLMRSLAALYHRQAVLADAKNQMPDTHWKKCVAFWQQHILSNNDFWDKFVTAYNAGKGRRERLKPEQISSWRQSLPEELARTHLKLAADFLKRGQRDGLRRNLQLVWTWEPKFEPEEDFLLAQIGGAEINDSLMETLEGALDAISSAKAQQPIRKIVAVYWCNKGSAQLNHQITILNALSSNAMMAQMALDAAKPRMLEALRWIKKAHKILPGDPDLKRQLDWAKKNCDAVNVYDW